MKEILITNDDGFEARGLIELANRLKKVANVTIVAPSSEKSACAQSLTLTRPLRLIKISDNFFKLDDATPADCVYLALDLLYQKRPDLIVSGINHGGNVCEDITCSGTCGAAMQGALQGIPSLAISQLYMGESLEIFGFDLACEIAENIVTKILQNGFPLSEKRLLNLNIPPVSKTDYNGLVIANVGQKFYTTDLLTQTDPRGFEHHWLGKMNLNFDMKINETTDIGLLCKGYATLTPLKLDLTAYEDMQKVKKWIEN